MLRSRKILLLTLSAFSILFFVQSASASVAYIDGNEVWVASDDGARKLRLSGGENDWREVAQSDQGYIVGTRREAGKISQLASFTVWDPSGKLYRFGSLSGAFTGGLNIYPLSIDITPSGGNIVYGFSAANFDFTSAGKGAYLKVSADATTAVPTALQGLMYPTLVGSRIVGTDGVGQVRVQDPSSIGSPNYVPWWNMTLVDHELHRFDGSADGTLFASEWENETNSLAQVDRVVMWKYGGFPTDSYIDDCLLPIVGPVHNVSVAPAGNLLTWADDRGVVIAPAPNMYSGGPPNCALASPPRVLAATGTYPSYGPFNVPEVTPTGVAKPTMSVSSSVKLSKALKSGFTVKVTSLSAGKAKVALTIKPSKVGKRGNKLITLATGSAAVTAGQVKSIKVKFTSAGKKLKKKLKGKKATLTVTVGAASTSKTVKLK